MKLTVLLLLAIVGWCVVGLVAVLAIVTPWWWWLVAAIAGFLAWHAVTDRQRQIDEAKRRHPAFKVHR